MTKRSKIALYLTAALLPMAIFVIIAMVVYDGPCPDAGEITSAIGQGGETMEYCNVRGVKHGPFVVVNSEGRRVAEGTHLDGALHGSYRRYSEGALQEMKCFSKGNIVWTSRDIEDMKTRKCTESDR